MDILVQKLVLCFAFFHLTFLEMELLGQRLYILLRLIHIAKLLFSEYFLKFTFLLSVIMNTVIWGIMNGSYIWSLNSNYNLTVNSIL